MKLSGVLLFLLGFISLANAQMAVAEEDIRAKFELLLAAKSDSVKIKICNEIEDSFEQVLLEEESFTYPFAKLDRMGKISSPDLKFRIYNWNCVFSDGSYRYFGILQYKEKSKFKIQILTDVKGANMFTSYLPNNWPGALYYRIIPFKSKGNTSYVLLGWDGNNVSSNKKLIEVITFGKTGITFGKPVISWRGKMLNRVIFEYAKQARMSIEYQEKENRIVFDHLAPSSPNYQNQFEYYGPDFTHDALIYNKGIWELRENIDVRKK